MADTNTKLIRRDRKSDESVRKFNMYKDTAVNAMKNVTEFDSKIIDSNEEYLDRLLQADASEYEILKENLKIAESQEERAEIRKRMAEMKKERYEKDTENKGFYEKQQESHKNYTKQVLCSVAAVAGLIYKFRKPIMDTGKKLLTKH